MPLAGRSCVLLDIEMPHCCGLEVLARLLDRGDAPPVILMTGGIPKTAPGARACLRKPIRPERLLAEIGGAFAA